MDPVLTSSEERLLAGQQISFIEALFDCAYHGELTEEQAREWLDGDDLAIALRMIATPHLCPPRAPEMKAWLAEYGCPSRDDR